MDRIFFFQKFFFRFSTTVPHNNTTTQQHNNTKQQHNNTAILIHSSSPSLHPSQSTSSTPLMAWLVANSSLPITPSLTFVIQGRCHRNKAWRSFARKASNLALVFQQAIRQIAFITFLSRFAGAAVRSLGSARAPTSRTRPRSSLVEQVEMARWQNCATTAW